MARQTVKFIKFTLDTKGVNQVLHEEFKDETHAAAEAMANAARSAMSAHPAEEGVVVEDHRSDERTYSEVTIRDPRGIYYERVEGVLSKAAMQQGLEVRSE